MIRLLFLLMPFSLIACASDERIMSSDLENRIISTRILSPDLYKIELIIDGKPLTCIKFSSLNKGGIDCFITEYK
jgi:hypothetical protein